MSLERKLAYGHDTDNCRTLRMIIEKLIKGGLLGRYVQEQGGGYHDKRPDKRPVPNKHLSRSPKRGRGKEKVQEKESGVEHERNDRGTVNTIAGGFSGGGATSSARKRYSRWESMHSRSTLLFPLLSRILRGHFLISMIL
jgi:hypothetical protein